jgi:hypothetical protein
VFELRRAASGAAVPGTLTQAAVGVNEAGSQHLYHGRTPDDREWRLIDSGRKVRRIESFTRG